MLGVNDITLAQRFSNFGRAIFAIHFMQTDRGHSGHTNIALRTEPFQALHIPAAVFPKPVIIADHDMANAEPFVQDDLDKLSIIHFPKCVIKWEFKEEVHAKIAENPLAQAWTHQTKRRCIRLKEATGMRTKEANPGGSL